MTRLIYCEPVRRNTWDTIANCKLQSGFGGEKWPEGEPPTEAAETSRPRDVCSWFLCPVLQVDEVWERRKGNTINHTDMCGGGSIIKQTGNFYTKFLFVGQAEKVGMATNIGELNKPYQAGKSLVNCDTGGVGGGVAVVTLTGGCAGDIYELVAEIPRRTWKQAPVSV